MTKKCGVCGNAYEISYEESLKSFIDICPDCIARMDDCESCKLNFEEDEKDGKD